MCKNQDSLHKRDGYMLLGIGALVKDSSSRLGTRLPFGKDLGLVSTSVTNLMFL